MPYGSCPVVCQQSPCSTDGSCRGGGVYSAASVGAGLGHGGDCLRSGGGPWGHADLPLEPGGDSPQHGRGLGQLAAAAEAQHCHEVCHCPGDVDCPRGFSLADYPGTGGYAHHPGGTTNSVAGAPQL